jgi:hypothetical protein
MKLFWRWLKRVLLVIGGLIVVLLAPVAYTEIACRPNEEPSVYQPILPPEYHRPESRTLMTYPEWHIVHAYEDYGHVLRTGDPHDYHYLRGIFGFWGSSCALFKASGQHGEVDFATKQMVYVIGVSFTAELLLKAAYEETVGRMFATLRGRDRAALDDLSAKQAQAYASFLQQTPWYKWDFEADAQALTNAASADLRDRERAFALGLEYIAKAAYADAIAVAVSEVGPDALTLRMIVTGTTPEAMSQLDGLTVIGLRNEGIEIETVRYRALTLLMQDLVNKGAEFVEIAGNDQIMFTILSDTAEHPNAIYSRARQGFGDHRHLIVVRVDALADSLRRLDDGSARLEHIHDY